MSPSEQTPSGTANKPPAEPERDATRLVQSVDVVTGRRSRLIELTAKNDWRLASRNLR
jgi:hypothetical protein